jgi:hypothetical protein
VIVIERSDRAEELYARREKKQYFGSKISELFVE